MEEELEFVYDSTKEDMDKAISHMEKALVKFVLVARTQRC